MTQNSFVDTIHQAESHVKSGGLKPLNAQNSTFFNVTTKNYLLYYGHHLNTCLSKLGTKILFTLNFNCTLNIFLLSRISPKKHSKILTTLIFKENLYTCGIFCVRFIS